MKNHLVFRNQNGQALNEMLIVIPLLMTLAMGMTHLALLIQKKIKFENACGQAARQFALDQFPSSDLGNAIWDDLGSEQKNFDKNSLIILAQQPKTFLGGDLQAKLGFVGAVMKDGLFNYGGEDWTITIRYKAMPLLGLLFPDGVLFQTRLAILRHPA